MLTETPDLAILRAERRLRRLEELTEIGMTLARELVQDPPCDLAPNAGSKTDAGKAPAKAPSRIDEYAKISRAIRLTITLEGRADDTLRDLQAGLPARIEAQRAAAEERAERYGRERHKQRRDLVARLVHEAADRDVADFMVVVDIDDAIDQRLDWDEAYDRIEDAPLRDAVEKLCHDLKLEVDWSLWTGDGWVSPGPLHRSRHSPFRCRSASALDMDREHDPDTEPDASPVVRPVRPVEPPDPPPA